VIILIISAISSEIYPGEEINFEYISGEGSSYELQIRNESRRVIKSEVELQEIWEEAYRDYPPSLKKSPPNVDFNKSLVIAVFWGSQLHGGYSVEINKIAVFNEKIVVYVTYCYPEPYGMYTQMIVYPQAIVKIDNTNKSIEFEIKEKHTLFGLNLIYWPPFILTIINLVATFIFIVKYKKRKVPPVDIHKSEEPRSEQKG
jgi:hypothetical protein